MNNIRIGIRLGTAFGFILLLLIITALTGFNRIHSLGDTAQELAGSRYQKASAATNLRYYSTDMSRLVRNVILADTQDRQPVSRRTMIGFVSKSPHRLTESTGCSRFPKAGN